MNKVLDWFYQRDRSEQIILALGALVLLIYVLWFMVLQPMGKAREEQRRINVATAEQLSRVRILAAELKSSEQQSGGSGRRRRGGGSIAELLDQTLRQNNLSMKGFQPSSNGEVKLRLDGVAFDNLLQWLYELESQHQVEVRELSVLSGKSAGIVIANVRLFKE
ncbi:MAG: type II secretion system protein M [Exilibacterium sp.]